MTMAVPETVFKFSAKDINGGTRSMQEFHGKVLLVVNVASKCGFTPQYQGLEELYRTYKERGFVVLGFPCNQFAGQEPGSESEIQSFCSRDFGVSFPLFSKIDVNGKDAHPLYVFLKRQAPGLLGTESIKWNFTKFLIDRTGHVQERFAPSTKPQDLAKRIEEYLDAPLTSE